MVITNYKDENEIKDIFNKMIGRIPNFTEVHKPQEKKDEKEFPMMIEFSDPNDKKEIFDKKYE